jgi:hypothetical protein
MPQKFKQTDLDKAVGKLRLLKMNPLSDPGVASALMEKLAAMCPHKEALEWLASRATDLYREWPGILELRALLCSRYKPADGVQTYSSVFEVIPSEHPAQESAQLALPPAHTASADSALEGMIADLARRKALPSREVVWERCAACQGTGQLGEAYCQCALGRDLERIKAKVKVTV